MPLYSAAPSTSLGHSLRNLFAGGGGLSPMDEAAINSIAIRDAKEASLGEKARAEAEAVRASNAARSDPRTATRFATHSAGMDEPAGTRLMGNLRGEMEPYSPNDAEDAAMNGAPTPSYRMAEPVMEPGQKRRFQSAVAATLANVLATGKTNADQLTKAGGNVQDQALTEQAINAPDVPAANRVIAAMSGKLNQPFKSGGQGTVLNSETGALNTGSDLAQGNVGRVNALGQAARAAAGQHGASADLSRERITQLKSGKPSTPIAPERVSRMIDMSSQQEYRIEKAAYDALPISQRKIAVPPSLAKIRDQVAKRYQRPTQAGSPADLTVEAHAAISGGKDPAAVKRRFKELTGTELPDPEDNGE